MSYWNVSIRTPPRSQLQDIVILEFTVTVPYLTFTYREFKSKVLVREALTLNIRVHNHVPHAHGHYPIRGAILSRTRRLHCFSR